MKNNIIIKQNSIQSEADQPGELGFTVFGEPVSKARARTVSKVDKSGKARVHSYTPAKTKDQEDRIAWVYKSIYGSFKFPTGVPLLVSMNFFLKIPQNSSKAIREKMLSGEIRPTKKNGDTDNYLKCATDALNGIAYEDDSQIVDITGRKYYSNEPRTEIFIARISDEE